MLTITIVIWFWLQNKLSYIILGVGGIFSGEDAFEKIKAGAVLVQIYTAMTYDGPPVVTKIKRELVEILKKEGLKSIKEAVGTN